MTRRAIGQVVMWQFELLAEFQALSHAVTSRHGGASQPPYDELNLGLHVGDAPEPVIESRRRVCAALAVDFTRATFGQQVHGDAVHVVNAAEAGRGRESFEDGLPAADGLVAAEPGIAIGVVVADCVPLLLYDPEHHVAAAVHAGWRGTAAEIAAKAVRTMVQHCGTRPGSLVAGIGPAIGRCCYEVSGEIARVLPTAEERDGRWCADLVEANRRQLVAASIQPANIEMSGLCTSCRSDEFYSERRLGRPTGRFGAFIALR